MYSKHTQIFGILGYPLGHTLSPWIHNNLFAFSKFDGVYLVFEKENWKETGLKPLLDLNVKGVSVTIPFKEWAFTQANSVCKASETMKASNTLVLTQDQISAHNTDGEGALRSILESDSRLLKPQDPSSILILGSGGSAKGILFSLAEYLKEKSKSLPSDQIKKKIKILARNQTAIQEIIDSLQAEDLILPITKEETMDSKKDISLVVHTTPLGMKGVGGEPLLDKNFFHKNCTLFDIVYNPLETSLVKEAKKAKSKIIPGYSMLLYQGIRQFEIFTGITPKDKWIRKLDSILLKELKKRN
ncbi:shikimate dehydrogenase family protein [Leptospira idonii]|uniref:Shikimate dehydrogenase n=1 Tax=Leptospira idonii TaxID=1193500 RepID=A0A4R9M824_9LEPT|nr:shikimate dehydrogenase [Leptospira idonii]TGN20718.1 shikimate dehydrogenase [Leptospira idonii]